MPAKDLASLGLRTVAGGEDRSAGGAASIVRANPLNSNGATDADGADAKHPLQSAPWAGGRGYERGSSPLKAALRSRRSPRDRLVFIVLEVGYAPEPQVLRHAEGQQARNQRPKTKGKTHEQRTEEDECERVTG